MAGIILLFSATEDISSSLFVDQHFFGSKTFMDTIFKIKLFGPKRFLHKNFVDLEFIFNIKMSFNKKSFHIKIIGLWPHRNEPSHPQPLRKNFLTFWKSQNFSKGGGEVGTPPLAKDQTITGFFLMKASLRISSKCVTNHLQKCLQTSFLANILE